MTKYCVLAKLRCVRFRIYPDGFAWVDSAPKVYQNVELWRVVRFNCLCLSQQIDINEIQARTLLSQYFIRTIEINCFCAF